MVPPQRYGDRCAALRSGMCPDEEMDCANNANSARQRAASGRGCRTVRGRTDPANRGEPHRPVDDRNRLLPRLFPPLDHIRHQQTDRRRFQGLSKADARTRTADPFSLRVKWIEGAGCARPTATTAGWRTYWRTASKSPANSRFLVSLENRIRLNGGSRVQIPPPPLEL